ncbi:MAG: shikimate dehydrogenase [Proteobacteria bacterium]|nr:shikimate dehydrogenase [Pseudomonadota bacterium]
MSRFAVLGSPIAHSLSPVIHQAFAKEAKLSITFEKILTPAGALKQTLDAFKVNGGQGACVTLPLKVEAFELCDHLTLAAKTAKAVNTLFWQAGKLWGDNTDGEGLLGYLQNDLGLVLEGRRILILGAGGATRGILDPLLKAGVQNIVIVNRTLTKAQALCTNPHITAYDYDTFNRSNELPFYLVINATSCSLQDALPPLEPEWVKGAYTVDLAYKQKQETLFQQWANKQGALLAEDGLGMLVWQAALGFKLWHHFLPHVKPVIQQLRQGAFQDADQ